MRYNVKMIKEDVPMKTKRASEVLLRDLLTVLPTLKKHKLETEVLTNVRRLRDGRRQKHYTLEVSRSFPRHDAENDKAVYKETKVGYITGNMLVERKLESAKLQVSAPITKDSKKTEILANLKTQIINQIKELRKAQLPVIETFTFREGVSVKKLAEVYLEAGTFVKVASRKVRLGMSKAKTPKTNDKYIGIEIEFACQEDGETLSDFLFEAGVGKYVHIKRDGSIKVDDTYRHAHEVTVLVTEPEYKEVVEKICYVLNNKVHIRIDKSCGLHVHLDMRNRKVEQCFFNLVSMQHLLYAMVPGNRKTSTYSVPVKEKKWAINGEHYQGISSSSYAKYHTIEMRMHCGTSQASKINNWIKLLVAIADAPLIATVPTSPRQAKDIVGIDDKLITYMDGRIAKFAKQHKSVGDIPFFEKVVPTVGIPPEMEIEVDEQSEVA